MDVDILLRRHGMPFSKCSHAPVFGGDRIAAVSHTPGRNVAKPVLVCCGGKFVLCVVPACCRVDLERVAQLLNADSAWLASEGDLARLFPDCEVGAPVPFGRPYGIPTVMDASLRDDEYVVFPAGTHTESVRMLRRDYERIAEPMVATIVRRPLAATRQSAALSV